MIGRQSVLFLGVGLASLMMFSSGQAVAQCNGGGGSGGGRGGGMPTGSATPLIQTNPYATNTLASLYPQSTVLTPQQYAAGVQNQIQALAYQNALRQRLARAEYEERILPMRLARAEAKRAARAARIAALVEKQNRESGGDSSDRYAFVSTTAK
ncbi:hypothetical protein Mal15_32970 [Stieleria maiorica]|uniref:Uncharacterized protein n=1 Tax=Stieleria maiorica TaxID=2795974 RepID=A0A5B9MI23_9BACT|nr:hypothetical protein [Stieleria maiorica]QEF99235.1 hypothetical protein Mal15_32970 [Stieleria maiorica]